MPLMNSSEALVETLVAEGVTNVFGIIGSAFMDLHDLFEPAGIRFISVAHEQNAAHMADGFSRVSNRHGVCIAQNGPGITNFVTGVAAAYWAHSPIVFITPEAGTPGTGLGGFQETDQMPIFSKITKYQAHVNRNDRIAELAHRCFTLAMAERGPAQLNIPRDYFFGNIDVSIPKSQPVERSAGGPQSLVEACRLLIEAKFPVILSGGGVAMGDGVEETKALAEYLSAPVVNTYLHNDSFPAYHELACGPLGYLGSKAAMRVIKKADVVLAVGTRLGPFGTLPFYDIDYWPKNAKIIQIDINHRVLGLVKDINVGIHGDAKLAAAEILRQLKASNSPIGCLKNRTERLAEINALKDSWHQELNSWSSSNEIPMSPRRVLQELEKAIPVNAIVSTDIGNVCSTANSYLRFNQSKSFLAAMSWGNCGYAFPTAMGAKIANPDRPAIAYVGDGAWGMSLPEVMTCVRENIPVTGIVFSNSQWGAEKKNQIDFYNNRCAGTNLNNPSFAEIAKAMGANGITIDHPSQVGDSLREAILSDKPTIIEIMLNQDLTEPFRRDALMKPKRLLKKYEAYSAD